MAVTVRSLHLAFWNFVYGLLCCSSLLIWCHLPYNSVYGVGLFSFCVALFGSDEKIALLGAIQSLFEGSMYTFVFLWTPALSPNGEDIPHGFIFATFMLASMLGSSLASRLMTQTSPRVESYMQIVFAISSASLLLPILTSVCHCSNISFSSLDILYSSRVL